MKKCGKSLKNYKKKCGKSVEKSKETVWKIFSALYKIQCRLYTLHCTGDMFTWPGVLIFYAKCIFMIFLFFIWKRTQTWGEMLMSNT